MGLLDRWGLGRLFGRDRIPVIDAEIVPDVDHVAALEARREVATTSLREAVTTEKREALALGGGLSLDPDDDIYRRLTSGAKFNRRDLNPLQQDRMLEVTWYLWEMNAFARRLITLMTDLILGDGVQVQADEPRVQAQIDATWNHPVNQLPKRIGEFYAGLSLSGELILPVADNPITGRPILGFIEPYQVKQVIPDPNNILIADVLELKPTGGASEGLKLKIVRPNPETGILEGEVFFFAINKLPNSLRGRSDLLPLADWLDLYDQYVFAEVERVALLSAFVWDYKIDGADEAKIQEKLRKFPKAKPGTVFAHNEKEAIDARTPDLKAQDRSEIGNFLRTHIAGSFGFPLSYLGEIDSNRATIEGQNDIMLKTPAARQKAFAAMLTMVVDYTVQHATRANAALFRDADVTSYRVVMPEIAAKDVARVGAVIGQVAAAMDTAIGNETMSKAGATTALVTVMKQLGVELDVQTVHDQVDEERTARQAADAERQQELAAARATLLAAQGTREPVAGTGVGAAA
jgi:hypothetical protein